MGVGVATADAFRSLIIQPGHYHVGADSPDSALCFRAGQGIDIDLDYSQREIVFSNNNILPVLSRESILQLENPALGQIVAVNENGQVSALAIFNGSQWSKVNLDSAL